MASEHKPMSVLSYEMSSTAVHLLQLASHTHTHKLEALSVLEMDHSVDRILV